MESTLAVFPIKIVHSDLWKIHTWKGFESSPFERCVYRHMWNGKKSLGWTTTYMYLLTSLWQYCNKEPGKSSDKNCIDISTARTE